MAKKPSRVVGEQLCFRLDGQLAEAIAREWDRTERRARTPVKIGDLLRQLVVDGIEARRKVS